MTVKTLGSMLLALLPAALLCFTAAAAEPPETTEVPCPHENLTETVVTEPTCTADGETLLTCAACGETFTVQTSALGHDFQPTETKEPTCTEDGAAAYACTRCGETTQEALPALGHDYQSIATAPTCTAEGSTVYTCSRCGDTYTETVPALGHDSKTETTEPTCTADGRTVTKCARCGETTEEKLSALGHDYQAAVTAPTCTAAGSTVYTCTRCGDTYTETTPALGHDFKTETIPATCTDDGRIVTKCTRCGEANSETVPAIGHQYSEWKTSKPSTWRTPGTEQCVCTNCGDTLTRSLPKLTHLAAGKCSPGDADMDGKVTTADARLILRFSVRLDDGLDAEQQKFCDFDGKDGVTPADARFALRTAVGLPPNEPEKPKTPKLAEGFTFKGYTSKDYVIAEKNGVTYIVTDYGYTLIANKTYALPASYAPGDLTAECAAALKEMQKAAAKSGIDLYVVSGYRSYATQQSVYNRYVNRDGKAEADTYSARPGHSEHQSGLAMDLNSLYASFAYTAEGKWLAANSWKYGFIIRYPKNKQSVTGYIYEPWHVRYLGKELAADVYKSGLCLEEYFGITSKYS